MRRSAPLAPALALVVTLGTGPVSAQETPQDEGLSLMERGAQMFLRGLMDEAEPAMKEMQRLIDEMQPAMRQFVQEMGPALSELLGKVDDLSNYHAPEMLPNGDIILRRKVPMPEAPAPGEGIDL